MDALFHAVFAYIGGYLLVKGLGWKYKPGALAVLALLSLIVDIEHLAENAGLRDLHSHTLIIVFVPLTAYLLMELTRSFPGTRHYVLIYSVMLFSHLCMDMIEGMYGIPLLYPLSDRLYLIPGDWEAYLNGNQTEPIIATQGIGVAIYFGVIALIIYLAGFFRSSAGSGKRRSTRI